MTPGGPARRNRAHSTPPPASGRQAVIVVNTEGEIQFWNTGAETLVGYKATETIGASLDLIIPSQYQEAHWAGFHRAMHTPAVKDLAADLPVRCADGQVRHLAGRLIVLLDALGNVAGAAAVFTGTGTTGIRPFS